MHRSTLQGRKGPAAAWFMPSEAFTANVFEALFGRAATSPIALKVAQVCATDAACRLIAALGLDALEAAQAPVPDHSSSWSGDVMATLPLGAVLLLDAPCMQALLEHCGMAADVPNPGVKSLPLVPIVQALKDVPFQLQVHLEGCEVLFGDVQELQVGDVLRVKHSLELPAEVRSEEGVTLFRGYLACSQGRKAVELVPVH